LVFSFFFVFSHVRIKVKKPYHQSKRILLIFYFIYYYYYYFIYYFIIIIIIYFLTKKNAFTQTKLGVDTYNPTYE